MPRHINEILTSVMSKLNKGDEMKCAFCEGNADLLCDYVHSWSLWESEKGRRVMCIDGNPLTCDAPICKSCRTKVGVSFDVGEKGSIDTKDLCPVHKNKADGYIGVELSVGVVEGRRLKDWKMKYFNKDNG